MDSKQIDNAMRKRTPVMWRGKQYDRILEYVMFYDNAGKRRLSVVLQGGRTSYRVPAEEVTEVE